MIYFWVRRSGTWAAAAVCSETRRPASCEPKHWPGNEPGKARTRRGTIDDFFVWTKDQWCVKCA